MLQKKHETINKISENEPPWSALLPRPAPARGVCPDWRAPMRKTMFCDVSNEIDPFSHLNMRYILQAHQALKGRASCVICPRLSCHRLRPRSLEEARSYAQSRSRTILYCTVLYYTLLLLYCTILHYTILLLSN